MVRKHIRMRPEGLGDYADVLHPETNTTMVLMSDTDETLQSKLDDIDIELTTKLDREESALRAEQLTTPRSIDGLIFDGTTNVSSYAVCETGGAEGVKVVTMANVQNVIGLPVRIKFLEENAHAEPTLSINAEIIGLMRTSNGSNFKDIKAGGIYTFVFDGTSFMLQGESGVNSGGGGGDLNVYIQPDEPEAKEGIWLSGNGVYDEIIEDYELYFANGSVPNPNEFTGFVDNIVHASSNGAVTVGDKMYVATSQYIAMYDYINQTLTNTSAQANGGCLSYHEGYIYFAQGAYIRRMNIETGVSSDIINLGTYDRIIAPTFFVGDEMFYVTKDTSGDYNVVGIRKYNLTTTARATVYQGSTYNNPLSQHIEASNRFYMRDNTIISIETRVNYSIMGYGHKFGEILLNEDMSAVVSHNIQTIHKTLDDYPNYKANPSVGISSVLVNETVYSYMTIASTATEPIYKAFIRRFDLTNKSVDMYETNAFPYLSAHAFYNGYIYSLGTPYRTDVGTWNANHSSFKSHVFSLNDKTLPENTLVLNRSGGANLFNVELISNNKLPFRNVTKLSDVYYYAQNKQQYYPIYYGNGVSWVKFKN